MLISLSCESRQEVDDLVAKAIAAGGTTYDKSGDFGYMYVHVSGTNALGAER